MLLGRKKKDCPWLWQLTILVYCSFEDMGQGKVQPEPWGANGLSSRDSVLFSQAGTDGWRSLLAGRRREGEALDGGGLHIAPSTKAKKLAMILQKSLGSTMMVFRATSFRGKTPRLQAPPHLWFLGLRRAFSLCFPVKWMADPCKDSQ